MQPYSVGTIRHRTRYGSVFCIDPLTAIIVVRNSHIQNCGHETDTLTDYMGYFFAHIQGYTDLTIHQPDAGYAKY